MAGCCGEYRKNRFFGLGFSTLIIGILLLGTYAGCLVATYLPSLYANGFSHVGYESYGIDNLFGAVCGVFAIIGGGIGSGIICSDKLTSKSSLMQAFLAFSIVGFLFSWMVALYNFNWTFIFAQYLFGSDSRYMWDPFLSGYRQWLAFYNQSETALIIMFSMHTVSAVLNSINGIIQFCSMVFICRGVKGYNDCTCCCHCCLPDLLSKRTTCNEEVPVSLNQVQPEVIVEPEITKNEESEATVYGDIEEGPETKEVLNGLDPVQNEQTDEVIEELKSELSRRQSAVPGSIAGPSVVMYEPESEPELEPEPEPEPAINPYAIGDDDIPAPDY